MRIDAIYARQSIEKKDSVSIDTQIDMCRRLCDDGAEVYQDSGFSGKNTNRPAFARLLQDVRAGKIKRVFCYRLDRISRSIVDFGLIWQTLDEFHTEFCSVTEQFDTSTPMGRAMVNIIIVFAQLERETIAERIKTNYYARTGAGAWGGGPAPFGFHRSRAEINGKMASVLEPDSDEIEIVKEMFRRYASGTVSLGMIASDLNKRGIGPGTKRNRWTNVNVRKVLNNPVYAVADIDLYSYYVSQGLNVQQDITLFDGSSAAYLVGSRDSSTRKRRAFSERQLALAHHAGVIPSDMFVQVQHNLRKNQQIKNKHHSTLTWTSGLLKCADCGYSIAVQKDQHGYIYMKCQGRYQLHICDRRHSIKPPEIEEYVSRAIRDRLAQLAETQTDAAPADPKVNEAKIRLIQIDQEMNNIVDAIKVGGASAMRLLSSELEQLEAERSALSEQVSSVRRASRLPDGLFLLSDINDLDFDSKRDIARLLIEKIVVGDDLEIVWKDFDNSQ